MSEEKKVVVISEQFAVALINYLNSKPRVEVNEFCGVLEQSPKLDMSKVEELLKETEEKE
jgi:hypothetical protein